MTPKQLMATGEWTRSGDWPHYEGEGPRYQHRTLDIRVQGYATHRNTRRRGGRGITKMRVWWLVINGKHERRESRFATVADQAVVSATNSAIRHPAAARPLAATEAAR